MKKPAILIVLLSIIIVFGIVAASMFDGDKQNNEFEDENIINDAPEPKSGRNLEVHLEEKVSMKTNP